ncbi:hypothetical protein F2Q69_00055476 [Brassica cretica]|uniref:Uncharacterized protein n=1 Tax=Brassica cretica TaxID=69181 RepID=A0A8S9MXG3_BRACR|nr:hypothetical protein F2Q69_00055476 [Brassica cretica]
MRRKAAGTTVEPIKQQQEEGDAFRRQCVESLRLSKHNAGRKIDHGRRIWKTATASLFFFDQWRRLL